MINHLPTFETCQKLKLAGFSQETEHYWGVPQYHPEYPEITHFRTQKEFEDEPNTGSNRFGIWSYTGDIEIGSYTETCAAPILTEILEQLPKSIGTYPERSKLQVHYDYDEWFFGYLKDNDERSTDGLFSRGENPAEAAALLWLKLNTK